MLRHTVVVCVNVCIFLIALVLCTVYIGSAHSRTHIYVFMQESNSKKKSQKKRNSLNSTTSHHDECKTLTKSIHIWCDSQTVTSIQKMHTQPMIIMFVCAYVCVWIYTYGINVASRYYKLCCLIPVLRCTACANLNLAMQITHLL